MVRVAVCSVVWLILAVLLIVTLLLWFLLGESVCAGVGAQCFFNGALHCCACLFVFVSFHEQRLRSFHGRVAQCFSMFLR